MNLTFMGVKTLVGMFSQHSSCVFLDLLHSWLNYVQRCVELCNKMRKVLLACESSIFVHEFFDDFFFLAKFVKIKEESRASVFIMHLVGCQVMVKMIHHHLEMIYKHAL
jgi:hypothetical protein